MGFTIISPPNSFVDFNPPTIITCLEQPDISLPQYNDFGIQFQFQVSGDLPASASLKAVILDAEGALLLDQNILAQNLCYQYRLSATAAMFPLTVGAGQPIPAGTYDYASFLAAIGTAIGTVIPSTLFDYCCLFPSMSIVTSGPTITFAAYWDFGFVAFPTTKMAGIVATGDCYRYGIADANGNILAMSNKFRSVPNTCFSTLISYWNDDDAFGFSYPTPAFNNTIRLPFSFRKPIYPIVEQIYQRSDGTYKRASSRVNKEYEGYTDVLTDYYHDRLIVAFKHDHVQFTNSDIGISALELFVQGDYKPDWTDDNTVVVAPAKFKISVPLSDVNNNCYSQTTVPCCPPYIVNTSSTDSTLTINVNFGLFVSSWNLQWRIAGTQIWNPVNNIMAKSYTIQSLPAGTNIEYQVQSNCGSSASGWSGSDFAVTTGSAPCDSSISGLAFTQTGSGFGVLNWTANGSAVQWKVQVDQLPAVVVNSPNYTPTGLAIGNHSVTITPVCQNGASGSQSQLSFAINGIPSITLVSSGDNGALATYVYMVGNSVSAGNKFNVTMFGYTVTVVAVSGDTPTSIAAKLATVILDTAKGTWGSGVVYKPTASSSGANLTITMDAAHSPSASASIS